AVRPDDLPVYAQRPGIDFEVGRRGARAELEFLPRPHAAEAHRTPGVRRRDVPALVVRIRAQTTRTREVVVNFVAGADVDRARAVVRAEGHHARFRAREAG